ncbi:DUF3667 domain-containing protein [Pararcticibacter amylolyticus]|uniref:DUF3667 domain-containing protein n=1 Tax=Pararcticibacter amylolyticus TaxID=2173175 RepID=A0A2U2PC49_9SPHI|nr:DUF3667 domain-containing protein [Pararcticibacter amylolyticus]PWG78940.1 hypothetical protein DDR33_20025 [Pararcticibacter amylolyticus]
MNCKNCSIELTSKYCPECGQPATVKRIDGHYIIHEIEHVLHFEKGIFYTIRELLIRPGDNIRHFLTENRSRLVKPVIFIIITSLIYTLSSHFFHVDDGYVKFEGAGHSTSTLIFKWVQDHYGYSNILMGIFIALWAKVFFRKYDYNLYEILILLCFVMGMGMLFLAVFAMVQGLTHFDLMQIASFICIIYCSWAIGQFFNKKKPVSYAKAFGAYVLGMITFSVTVVLLGALIDLAIHSQAK